MMTDRLYYDDAYTTRFAAHAMERVTDNGRFAIILNHTYFYPASGGQPADSGEINGVPVVDVTIRPDDGAVLHWVETAIEHEEVTAVIHWPRRFDHMQHHTGQHILSQAFIRIANAQTIGFHMSGESVTIDLDKTTLTTDQIQQVEQLANQIVWENRPIHVRMVTLDEAKKLPLRKLPPIKNGRLRLIDIEDFDLTACGGTHVAQTGAVGLIKIIKQERRNEKLRIEFCCGGRALADYGRKHEVVSQLTTNLTTGQADLVTAVSRLQTENKETRRALRKTRSQLLTAKANQLLAAGQKIGPATIVTHVFDAVDDVDLRVIGSQLAQRPGVVALLGMGGNKSQLFFCRAKDAPGDMNALLQSALKELGKGGGGGTAVSAQGGGPKVENGRLNQAIQNTEKQLHQQLKK